MTRRVASRRLSRVLKKIKIAGKTVKENKSPPKPKSIKPIADAAMRHL
jgi:hypothetical protein